MSSGPFSPQFKEPACDGARGNSALLPCGIGDPRHAFDCMSGFPD
jgi:hypothetical protein